VLVEPAEIADEARRQQAAGHRVGVLAPAAPTSASIPGDVIIAEPDSMKAYAHRLYQLLREFDERGCGVIVASLPSQLGLGLALTDRLRRAAGPRASLLRPDAQNESAQSEPRTTTRAKPG
jgi:L-threonylcarbamoyladenylate synthase